MTPHVNSDLHVCSKLGSEGEVKNFLAARAEDDATLDEKDELDCAPILWGCRSGSIDVVKSLIEAGADIESKGYGGMRGLHHACNIYCEPVVQALLDKGANVKATDDAGNTPLHWSASRGVLKIVQMVSGCSVLQLYA